MGLENILKQVELSYQHLEAFQRGERGTLKIGFFKRLLNFELLREFITEFHQKYPHIQLELGGYT